MIALAFLAPARLVLLVLPIILTVAYLVVQARRRRYALRFTTLDLLDEVAPDRPGWRRHLPAAVHASSCLVDRPVPKAWLDDVSRTSHSSSSWSAIVSRTWGSLVRAVTAQSMWRGSSPGT